ncbi:superoxide dismutase [Cu-Zn]-like [Schistocerca cancellata]|uniref:superoxide dismutase [Cu-Zn]-like n=1 Tax=Schistocerca cancellata TaxID=274614 RepID=UPI00211957FF|nr:superoxide dismutase [Cu-Zn]-like [Schistocerca cancellata]XP_049762305.1 superoxide dismutase [Cu-Zn]-like [Schistocerca cancellata]XP_049762311.1 superoxide dismutase [Cu-Zn]-like [Schistocerca cancellata]XP_049762319.1 superoxide dismutase [Cu-Zn]-like [Schistocerca cancellata]XP_049762325.1 superoxide dismutase [Cu-Zn]-like [Schistocerca cancellata]
MTTMVLRLLVVAAVAAVALAEERRAIAILSHSTKNVKGNVTFVQTDDGVVTVTGIIEGLKPGSHGFHIHEKGDISSCINAGGHFNPDKVNHGGPTDAIRHVGDLGNIEAGENGVANISIRDRVISLTGRNNILGRSVVVHSDKDDLGKGGFEDSLTTGHAGTREACGVIGILSPVTPWHNSASTARFGPAIFLSTAVLLAVSYLM